MRCKVMEISANIYANVQRVHGSKPGIVYHAAKSLYLYDLESGKTTKVSTDPMGTTVIPMAKRRRNKKRFLLLPGHVT